MAATPFTVQPSRSYVPEPVSTVFTVAPLEILTEPVFALIEPPLSVTAPVTIRPADAGTEPVMLNTEAAVLVKVPRRLPPPITTGQPAEVRVVSVGPAPVIVALVMVNGSEPVTATVPSHESWARVMAKPVCIAKVVVLPNSGPAAQRANKKIGRKPKLEHNQKNHLLRVAADTEPMPLCTAQPSSVTVPAPPFPSTVLPVTVTPLITSITPLAVSAPLRLSPVAGPTTRVVLVLTTAVRDTDAAAVLLTVPCRVPLETTTPAPDALCNTAAEPVTEAAAMVRVAEPVAVTKTVPAAHVSDGIARLVVPRAKVVVRVAVGPSAVM